MKALLNPVGQFLNDILSCPAFCDTEHYGLWWGLRSPSGSFLLLLHVISWVLHELQTWGPGIQSVTLLILRLELKGRFSQTNPGMDLCSVLKPKPHSSNFSSEPYYSAHELGHPAGSVRGAWSS